VQSALFRAARTGEGDHVDLSLMDAMLGMLVYECQEAQFPAERRRPLYRPTKARDGFLLIAPVSQNNFEALARGTGHPEWITDPRFAISQDREHHWGELMQLLDDWAGPQSAAECEAAMNAAGVPCSRYFTVREAMQLPPLQERHAFQTIDDGSGPFQVPNPAFRFARTAAHARNSVPALGGDGPALLGSLLGLSDERVAALRESRTLHVHG